MAQAQLIQGSAEELLAYLEQRRDKKNLLLIVPEEDNVLDTRSSTRNQQSEARSNAAIRNGVPLFPTQGAAQPVTPELVKHLLEEE
jgi:hypothetical protein